MAKTTTFREQLESLGACSPALNWVGDRDAETAWRECEDGEWMLWLIGKVAGGEVDSPERKRLVLAVCECARQLLVYVPVGDAPRIALETAERYGRGEATLEEVRVYACVYHEYPYFAYAAASVACSTCPAAADGDYTAVAYGGTSCSLRKSADIIRRHYPEPPVIRKEPN